MLLLGVLAETSCNGCMSEFMNGSIHVDSTSTTVYSNYQALSDGGWAKDDTIVFDLPMTDTGADLDVTISVRYTNKYPYQNLEITAFLAEQDTTNFINSLQIRKNDELVDSLMQRNDSLNAEREKAEHYLAERVAQRDSMLRANRDSVVAAERRDSLRRDSLRKAKAMELASADTSFSDSAVADSGQVLEPTVEGKTKERAKPDSIATAKSLLTKTFMYSLFNDNDKRNGVGILFVETSLNCGTIHVKGNTRYKLIITHNMKDDVLKGISDIGVELKRSENTKPLYKNTRWW